MLKIVMAVIAGVMFFTGCATGTEGNQARNQSETGMTNQEYADIVRDEAPSLSSVPTRLLIKNANQVCSAFDSDATFEDVATVFLESGFTPREAGTLIGGAVAFKCPEHETLLDSGSSV